MYLHGVVFSIYLHAGTDVYLLIKQILFLNFLMILKTNGAGIHYYFIKEANQDLEKTLTNAGHSTLKCCFQNLTSHGHNFHFKAVSTTDEPICGARQRNKCKE